MKNIRVGFQDGETVGAELLGRDPATDLALLRTPKRVSSAPTWSEPESLRVAHIVLALGRPGVNVRATLGIVSALGKAWRTPVGGLVDWYLQTDTVMYPGFSGGPLVDAQGRFVGLNSSALVRGVSITVPAPTINRVVQDLRDHGSVRRAYLGVGGQPTRLPDAVAKELEQETGSCWSRWRRAAQPSREGCSWAIPWSPWTARRYATWTTFSTVWAATASASPSRYASSGVDNCWS